MSLQDIIRAWKDPDYRATLSKKQRDQLPKHPAGGIEILEEELLESIVGGYFGDTLPAPMALCSQA